jgi:subtilisin-like proprotein convertase family protein
MPSATQLKTIMKKLFLSGVCFLGMLSAHATIYYQGSMSGDVNLGSVANNTIVDGNPANLTVNTMTLSGAEVSLSSLTVSLNISGGMNNGLYGYLVAPNGAAVTLLNRPGYAVDGFGATGSGMQIALVTSGGANGDIQAMTSGSFLGGGSYPQYNSAASFSSLNGINPNGVWTLYFSDTLTGGGDATLNGWSLDITAVPEPVNLALVGFLGFMAMAGFARSMRRKQFQLDSIHSHSLEQ